MVGKLEVHPAHNKPHSTNPQRFFPGTGRGGAPERELHDSG